MRIMQTDDVDALIEEVEQHYVDSIQRAVRLSSQYHPYQRSSTDIHRPPQQSVAHPPVDAPSGDYRHESEGWRSREGNQFLFHDEFDDGEDNGAHATTATRSGRAATSPAPSSPYRYHTSAPLYSTTSPPLPASTPPPAVEGSSTAAAAAAPPPLTHNRRGSTHREYLQQHAPHLTASTATAAAAAASSSPSRGASIWDDSGYTTPPEKRGSLYHYPNQQQQAQPNTTSTSPAAPRRSRPLPPPLDDISSLTQDGSEQAGLGTLRQSLSEASARGGGFFGSGSCLSSPLWSAVAGASGASGAQRRTSFAKSHDASSVRRHSSPTREGVRSRSQRSLRWCSPGSTSTTTTEEAEFISEDEAGRLIGVPSSDEEGAGHHHSRTLSMRRRLARSADSLEFQPRIIERQQHRRQAFPGGDSVAVAGGATTTAVAEESAGSGAGPASGDDVANGEKTAAATGGSGGEGSLRKDGGNPLEQHGGGGDHHLFLSSSSSIDGEPLSNESFYSGGSLMDSSMPTPKEQFRTFRPASGFSLDSSLSYYSDLYYEEEEEEDMAAAMEERDRHMKAQLRTAKGKKKLAASGATAAPNGGGSGGARKASSSPAAAKLAAARRSSVSMTTDPSPSMSLAKPMLTSPGADRRHAGVLRRSSALLYTKRVPQPPSAQPASADPAASTSAAGGAKPSGKKKLKAKAATNDGKMKANSATQPTIMPPSRILLDGKSLRRMGGGGVHPGHSGGSIAPSMATSRQGGIYPQPGLLYGSLLPTASRRTAVFVSTSSSPSVAPPLNPSQPSQQQHPIRESQQMDSSDMQLPVPPFQQQQHPSGAAAGAGQQLAWASGSYASVPSPRTLLQPQQQESVPKVLYTGFTSVRPWRSASQKHQEALLGGGGISTGMEGRRGMIQQSIQVPATANSNRRASSAAPTQQQQPNSVVQRFAIATYV